MKEPMFMAYRALIKQNKKAPDSVLSGAFFIVLIFFT
jgi:hypothetical protein